MNNEVLNWYLDQSAGYFGTILALVLLIIIIVKLHRFKNKNNTPISLKLSIYSLYISYLFVFIQIDLYLGGLPLIKSFGYAINQSTYCSVIVRINIFTAIIMQMSIITLYTERLKISFSKSTFALSKRTIHIIRFITCFIGLIVIILFNITADPSPFNIYTEEIDYNGNGVTCSPLSGDKAHIFLLASLGFYVLSTLTGNITMWVLFMRKLYKL